MRLVKKANASTFNKVIYFCVQKFPPSMQASGLFVHLGPVPQNPIKLILDQWKVLIAIYLTLKKGFFTRLRFKEK